MNIRRIKNFIEIFIVAILLFSCFVLVFDLFIEGFSFQSKYTFTINKVILLCLLVGLLIWVINLLNLKRKLQAKLLLQLKIYLSMEADKINVKEVIDELVNTLVLLGYKDEPLTSIPSLDILINEFRKEKRL
jgi:hypothetical protein